MVTSLRTVLTFTAAFSFFSISGNLAYSQEKTQQKSHFKYQTVVGLGLSGTQFSHRAVKIDENGFPYDLKSLLNSGGRKELNISNDQYTEITTILDDAVEQMKEVPNRSIFSGDQSELEILYKNAEKEALKILTEEQKNNLTLYRHKMGIQTVGLAKYLSSSHFGKEGDFSKEDLSKLSSLDKEIEKEVARQTSVARKSANQKLIDSLSDEQQDKLKESFGKKFESKFLDGQLFVNKHPPKKLYFPKRKTFLYQVLKLKLHQRKLNLSKKQLEQIADLRPEGKDKISQILNQKQFEKLQLLTALRDVKSRGTVIALSSKYLSVFLEMSEDQSRGLYEEGLNIYNDLNLQLKSIKRVAFRKASGNQSEIVRQRMLQILGD